jgi:hypothetical protein
LAAARDVGSAVATLVGLTSTATRLARGNSSCNSANLVLVAGWIALQVTESNVLLSVRLRIACPCYPLPFEALTISGLGR